MYNPRAMATDLFSRWKDGLSRSSKATFGRLAGMLGATEITEQTWDDLEALLIQADLGIETAQSVILALKQQVYDRGLTRGSELRDVLRAELRSRLISPSPVAFPAKPTVVLLVGVNGSGKTTTAAKLAGRFMNEGRSTLLGAADTFRAAAVDQLQVWGDRLHVPVITGAPESDPGAVAFSTVQAGAARGADVVLVDTAGRLQTRYNLMEELKKVRRVVDKAMPGAPHHVWLVLDATTGQNALHQASAFKDAVGVTAVILAKLDSSARGGMAFAIQSTLGLPILFAGLGEKAEDLTPFDPDAFVDGILQG
jgi:fused signal recognition particle receptor